MAHGMTELDKMGSARMSKRSVWHFGQGTNVDLQEEMMSCQDVRERYLGWEPRLVPAYVRVDDQQFMAVPDKKAVIRDDLPTDDPRRVLGIVGSKYTPILNDTIIEFADAMSNFGVHVDTAGTIWGGRRVYITVKIPGGQDVMDDRLENFLVITSGHDGVHEFQAMNTPIRVVCQNTLSAAIRSAQASVSIRHTKNFANKFDEAARVMETATKYFADHARIMANLASVKLTTKQADEFIAAIVPSEGTRGENIRKDIARLYGGAQIGGDQDAVKDSAYGMVNAFTQYIETARSVKIGKDSNGKKKRSDAEARLDSVLFGSGAIMRQRVMDQALTLIGG